ncbi:RNA-binding protein 5-A-like isoform X2 [Malaya genurostris]|uniref:RNA-binding protein 5-A-like isoform X2 n=1 Tax=Malaya genurostris TaxID=325434 RepID=UPI0026F409A9|nr:RNA-binding protein 5-A-like isoform X2 [Malaya genurostris]
MDFSPSPESDTSGYYRNRNHRDDRDRGNRGRSKERHYRSSRYSRSRSRSYSRERYISNSNRRSPERDLYRDLIDQDYGDNSYDNRDRYRHRSRDRDRRSRERDRKDRDKQNKRNNYSPVHNANDFDDNYDSGDNQEFFYQQKPNNKIIIRGLAAHITEADINSDLIQCGLQALHVRLIRRKRTGASRGFAFVEFRTEEEATRWICYKQGMLIFNDHRAVMQYTYSLPAEMRAKDKPPTDWYCAKCGVFNFKRRENCFKCFASREESEKGGEGSDEISSILTKKIMLRNLDVLTNEESVLCTMQEKVPELVSKISKIMICRDPLTQTSRGICYLHFDNLLDSMNTYNALKAITPILKIDSREVLITYCVDAENRNLIKGANSKTANKCDYYQDPATAIAAAAAAGPYPSNYEYTLADVPRLAEYSASVYASNPTEHEHYLQFYTNYYVTQISQGQMTSLPSEAQLGETANSGAAVAQSALARKQSKNKSEASSTASTSTSSNPAAIIAPQPLQIPNGTDGKKYPAPDVSQYQYDETSGFYYDPSTGLYYDSNSQYYYNNETCSYLYWDTENSTYVAAPSTSTAASTATDSTAAAANGDKTEKTKSKDQPHDKVKVAKKIVKDMEKWAKQLNQKKDYSVLQPPAKVEEATLYSSQGQISGKPVESSGGYADVGFSLLEKKQTTQAVSNFLMGQAKAATSKANSNLVSQYGSDSDNDGEEALSDRDYVDFEKLTCLLCKRAFQSQEILNKHLKMSSLHKENLQKFNLQRGTGASSGMTNKGGSYRDRAKERRLKYGEADPPPVNKSKERFQRELEKQTQAAFTPNIASVPISQSNVGNKLLQKMGWSEGQGLGRSNQGRTNIIETETRVANAGLGIKASQYGNTGDDYKTYIKKMMKSRYEQVDVKD